MRSSTLRRRATPQPTSQPTTPSLPDAGVLGRRRGGQRAAFGFDRGRCSSRRRWRRRIRCGDRRRRTVRTHAMARRVASESRRPARGRREGRRCRGRGRCLRRLVHRERPGRDVAVCRGLRRRPIVRLRILDDEHQPRPRGDRSCRSSSTVRDLPPSSLLFFSSALVGVHRRRRRDLLEANTAQRERARTVDSSRSLSRSVLRTTTRTTFAI